MDEIELPEMAQGEDKSSPFKNCLRNNYRHVRKWARRTKTNCFRIYDRQLHHYPLAIDFYAGRYCVHYFSKHRDEPEPEPSLVEEVNQTLKELLQANLDFIYWRHRIRRAKTQQYEKEAQTEDFFLVQEYGVKFGVNLVDYLDTGLFLDHRETRHLVAQASRGKRLLNLFSYTCSFSVHAAVSGALFTKSVDMSNTYTAWGRENFEVNGIRPENHPIIRADCLVFLDEEIDSGAKYDLIVIDPPTISRSKKMEKMFDVQVEYDFLIQKSLELLDNDGVIFFSTNLRSFVFDENLFENCQVREISEKTIPLDFHDAKIHRCWKIFRKKEA
jgi:23S rRNA (cytosine1962-C5)-methyltransferase